MNYSEVSHIAFDASLPMLLNDALDGVMPAYRSIFSAHDLTEQQWRVLRVLWDETEMANIHISRRTLIPTNSLVGVLERLEKRGLIARTRSVDDRRVMLARLTTKGRGLGEAVGPALKQVHDEVAQRLSKAEWEMLSKLLKLASGRTAK